MNTYFSQRNRDLPINEAVVTFSNCPSQKNLVEEVTVVLYPDNLLFPSSETENINSKHPNTSRFKSLIACTIEHMAAINIFKIFVEVKNLRNTSVLLNQLSTFTSNHPEYNRHFINPFVHLSSLEGRPVRSSCELLAFKVIVSSYRKLTKLELISLSKIFHRIPFIVTEPPSPIGPPTSIKRQRGRSLIITEIEQHHEEIDIPLKGRETVTSINSPVSSVQTSCIIETISDDESLSPCSPAKIMDCCWSGEFKLHEEIGKGNFATVKRCTRKTSSEDSYAVKFIDSETYQARMDFIQREIDIIWRIRYFDEDSSDTFSARSHPNIITCYCIYRNMQTGMAIITEYANNGDLFSHITGILSEVSDEAKIPCMEEGESAKIIHQCISALDHLQQHDICHRDIKPENILMHKSQDGRLLVKICDFGLAVQISGATVPTEKSKSLNGICGTPYYIAPEMLLQEGYGVMVDIWAIGVVLFVMLTGYPPFFSEIEDQNEIFDQILEAELDLHSQKHISHDATMLIYSLMCFDPDFRIRPHQALEHAWFQKLK